MTLLVAAPLSAAESYQEKKLKGVYEDLLARLPDAARVSLEASQSAWFIYRQKACDVDNLIKDAQKGQKRKKGSFYARIGGGNCTSRLTEERLRYLQMLQYNLDSLEKAKDSVPDWKATCRLQNMPPDAVMYGVSTYKGLTPVDAKLAGSSHKVTTVDVVVNEPRHPVILVLNAYDPVIWKVSRTPKSRIAAIIIVGYESQALLGVPAATPQLFICMRGRQDCPDPSMFRFGNNLLRAAERLRALTGVELRQVIKKPREQKFFVPNGDNVDTASLVFSDELKLSLYTDTGKVK